MVDFQSPGSKAIQVRKGPVVLPGIATAIGGFHVYTEKGPVGIPTLVTSPDDGAELFGDRITSPGNSRLTDSLQNFFNTGGQSCYVMGYKGTGSLAAARNLSTTGGATAGSLTSSASSFPVALSPGDTFIGSVDGVAQGTVTIQATKATKLGTGATYAAVANGTTMVVSLAGIPGNQTITFDGTESSQATFLAQINVQLRGGRAVNAAGQVRLESDILGSSAAGTIVSLGTGLAASTGLTTGAFTNAGPNNVATVDAVTATELKTLFDATFTGTSAKTSLTTVNANGSVTWASTSSTGAGSSVQLTGGTGVAKVSGFDTTLHSGTASSTIPTATMTASSTGSWGNIVSVKSTKVDTIVAKVAATSAGATTTISVSSSARLNIGDTISITKTGNTQRAVVRLINGLVLTLATSITVPGGGYAGTEDVVLETFDVTVYNADGTIYAPSPFRNLRMSPLAGSSYFVNVINAASRSPIVAADLSAAAADPRPATDSVSVVMSGGSDGAAPTASDVIATIANWDKADDVNFISAPGIATDFSGANGVAILKAYEAYGETREDVQIIVDLPKGTPATGVGGVKEYVQITANLASSYEAVYWPWCGRLDSVTNVNQVFPPSPFVQGVIARTHQNRGFGKAPAGIIDGQIPNITYLETEIGEQSAEYNDFYPANVNAILKFRGQGFAVFGSRTMDPTGEFGQINVQTVFNIYKREAKKRTRFVNFEGNDTSTRGTATRVLTALFREGRKAGTLKGERDSDAFYVICNDSNNGPTVSNSGKMKIRVGLAVVRATEFLEFSFEQDTRALDRELAGL